jgi:SAM-dependent methyltransferase
MIYDPEYTKNFYNAYGTLEWSRLEATAYGRLQATIHSDFIERYIKKENRVLDAGSGPGRFSIVAARLGAKVTVLDISSRQLVLAKQRVAEADLSNNIEEYIEADIANLSMLSAGYFDVTVCFGGPLSYVCEERIQAVSELLRVTRPGGFLLISVMSHYGAIRTVTGQPDLHALKEPDTHKSGEPAFRQVLKTGDLRGFPSRRVGMQHASMHLYTASELHRLFKDCEILETAGSNVTITEYSSAGDQISADPTAWLTLVDTERMINRDPGLVNSGTHIILVARR